MTLPAWPFLRGARRGFAAGHLCIAILLGGCATPQLQALRDTGGGGLPEQAELPAVPYFAQTEFHCGPAALAMVLSANRKPVTPEDLSAQVYLPGRQGSLQAEMLAAARRHGALALTLAPRLGDLLSEVAAGNPVIVLQNLALDWYPMWHYAVLVGFDRKREIMVLRSGDQARQELPMATFERTWARSGRWALLALAPGRLPATVSADAYAAAASLLERNVTAAESSLVYESGLVLWPDREALLIGLGNSAYLGNDLARAEDAFRRAVAAHRDSSAARNNLAHVLADRGRLEEAAAIAREALALGGINAEVAARTLAEIERLRAAD